MLDKDSLIARVAILKDAGVVSEDIAEFAGTVISNLDSNFKQEMCEMYITHLVMALNRVKNDEPVETLDAAIFEEVTKNENFVDAQKLYEELGAKMPYELPRQEKEFLLMHLTNLLENR